jgi:hypothetical protein
MGIQEVNSSSA